MINIGNWLYRQGEHADGEHEERKVGWLELFYDLVYVATLIQLGNMLSDDVSLGGFIRFAALFIPIWWAWTGITFYVNRFIIDDVWHRVLIFVQIFAISALAISVPGVFTESIQAATPEAAGGPDLVVQFTLAYVVIRAILVILYLRAWRNVPETRRLCMGYMVGFTLGAAVWLVSIFFPAPLRYVLWGVGILIELGVPLVPYMIRWQMRFVPDIEHMSERYGIFTIIVLGESFVKVIDGQSGSGFNLETILVAIFGTAIACSLWWLYFDDVAGSVVRRDRPWSLVTWIYSHLPTAMAITAFGVAAKKLLQEAPNDPFSDNYRVLMGAMLVIYLIFVGIIDRHTYREDESISGLRRSLWRFGAAAVVLALTIIEGSLTPTLFAGLIAAVFVIQVGVDVLSERQALLASGGHPPAHDSPATVEEGG